MYKMVIKFKRVGRNGLQSTLSADVCGDVWISRCSAHRDDPEMLRCVLYVGDTSYTIHGERRGNVLLFCHQLYNIRASKDMMLSACFMGYDNTILSAQRVLEMTCNSTPSIEIYNPLQTVVLGKCNGEMIVSYHHEWRILHTVIYDQAYTTLLFGYALPYQLTIRHINIPNGAQQLMIRAGNNVTRCDIGSVLPFIVTDNTVKLVLFDQHSQPLPWPDDWLIVATIDKK